MNIIFTNDIARARKEYDGILGESEITDAAGLHVHGRDGGPHHWASFVFLKLNAPIAEVAHEASHVIERLFDWSGVRKYDGEMLAYHYGWLVGQIASFQKSLRRKHERHNRKTKRPVLRKVRSIAPTADVDPAGED